MGIAFQQAGGHWIPLGIFEDGIDGCDCEDSGQDRSQSPACAMNAEGVKRVVIPEFRFHLGDHPVAEHACDQSDEHGGHRLDESGCWSNCH